MEALDLLVCLYFMQDGKTRSPWVLSLIVQETVYFLGALKINTEIMLKGNTVSDACTARHRSFQ